MSEELIPRGARAAVFAAACVMLSAVTHAIVTRGATPLWAVLVALVVVYLAALPATSRERGLGAICAVAVAVQLSLDVWFSLAQADSAIVRDCGLFQALPTMGDSITCAHQTVQAAGPVHVSPALLAGQIVVALLCAWPLQQGETAQYALRQWLSARGLDLWAAIAVVFARPLSREFGPAVTERPTDLAPPPRRMLRFEVVRRGPPSALVSV
jgi:hypothetical protein